MLKEILEAKVKMGGYSSDEGYFAACIREGLKGQDNVSVLRVKNPGEEHLVEGVFLIKDEDGKTKKHAFSINTYDVLGTR